MFWDQDVEHEIATMLPVQYIRTGIDQYVFPDFVGCGKELVVNIVNESLDPGYYDIELEMDGGQYDDYADVPRTYLEDEETDGIANMAAPTEFSKTYYDFQGRRVNTMKGGLSIENGRKVIR